MFLSSIPARSRAVIATLSSLLLIVSVFGGESAASADTAPVNSSEPVSVSSDALPTPQIDGVVWAQVVSGNTVYVGGDFQTVRPAGSAAGVNAVTQPYLFAYDITTGAMITTFRPVVNAQVKALALSPDGTKLYVGGQFTSINSVSRYRVAMFDLPSATLDSTFKPAPNATVSALAASSTTLYIGGTLSAMGSTTRSKAAAVDATTGALLPWAPVAAGGNVAALAISPDGTKVSLGGAFTTLNGGNGKTNPGFGGYGMGIVSATGTGTTNLSMVANNLVRDATSTSGITSMSSDSDSLYVTGYDFGSGGNFEGTLRLNWADGSIIWMEDCHGDTYSAFAMNGLVYKASHAHTCVTVPDGFPETTVRTHHYALAFTKAVYGVLGTNPASGYTNYAGQPAPDQVNWYPDFTPGTYTGQDQATWDVSGNSQYIVYGGEFLTVNGKAQQGLTRFAVPSIAPNKDGPRVSGADWVPTAQSLSPGTITVTWPANYDRDNELLTYNIRRDGNNSSPIGSVTAISRFYDTTQTVSFIDTDVAPGSQHSYTIQAVDPYGNVATSTSVTATASTGTLPSAYAQGVLASNADHYWRLDEPSGTAAADIATGLGLTTKAGVTRNVNGAIAGDTDTASQFNGTSTGYASTSTAELAPQVFSLEAWFKTNSTSGGKILGFGNASTGNSTLVDRHIYLDTAGHLNFGVYAGANKVITTTGTYRDNQWHDVVATLSNAGMVLYVDGAKVASNTTVTTARAGSGYWRVGGDTSWASGSGYLNGTIDEAAVYNSALTSTQVANHYALATGGTTVNSPPTAAFTSSASGATLTVNGSTSSDVDGTISSYAWNFGDGTATVTGSTAAATHTYTASGPYTVTLTVTANGGATGSTTSSVNIVVPPPANVPPTAAFTSAPSGLTVAFDGSGSSDSDGTIASYSWNFGDGTAAGSGVSPTHTYSAANTYPVSLTVTDNQGASTTVSHNVVVVASGTSTVFAQDAFGRTSTSGWGTADIGGAWTVSGGASNFSVGSGVGTMSLPAASSSLYSRLNGVSSTSTDVTVTTTLNQTVAGASEQVALLGRVVGSADYRAQLTVNTAGKVVLALQNGSTLLKNATVAGLTYTAGTPLNVELQVFGASPTTIQAKVWVAGTTVPSAWQLTTTDSTSALQVAGGVGVYAFIGSGSTGFPRTVSFDNLVAQSVGGATPPANVAPTAVFTSTASGLSVAFDGSGSSDSDGTIVSYSWNFGDGTGTGVSPTHVFSAAGTYSVVLTVTDNGGLTGTATQSVTVASAPPANVAPTAAFTSTATGLSVAFDGSGSSDSDGTIASYSWNFGDGTGTGISPTHVFSAAGTYSVVLTVTDNGGLTGTTTQSITVSTTAVPPIAQDTFARTVVSGWGAADTGGAWSLTGGASNFSVNSGIGTMSLSAASAGLTAKLSSVSSTSTDVTVTTSLNQTVAGGSEQFAVLGRVVGSADYRAQLTVNTAGKVVVALQNGSTLLKNATVAGITYTAGMQLNMELQVYGTGTTTIRVKVWATGTTAPAAWQVSTTDSTAALQVAGGIGLYAYLSSGSTGLPRTVSFSNLMAVPAA